jgi:hypothetical protein
LVADDVGVRAFDIEKSSPARPLPPFDAVVTALDAVELNAAGNVIGLRQPAQISRCPLRLCA